MLRAHLLVGAFFAFASGLNPDPCDPVNHNELNEPHRSTGYHTGYPETPLCDLHMVAGWYRFTSGSGGEMPTTCPKRLSCGSVVPIWMQGSHPSVNDGVVIRTACANFETGGAQTNPCCEHSVSIGVKNCGQFYVYYLRPTPSCPMAYCAGTMAPCPMGKWSPTSFPPCKDAYPMLKTPPTMSGPVIHGNKSFSFDCKIDYPHSDPDQRFEVVWTFDGKEDPNVLPEVVTDPHRVATLDGSHLKGHMNTNVGCKLRSYYDGNRAHKGAFLKSNVYYAGIRISPHTMVVSEKDYSKDIQISSTIPILCDHDVNCCLIFKLDVDDETEMSIETACDYSMCSNDWDPVRNIAEIKVPVVAYQDMIDDGDQQLLVSFEKLLPSGGGPYQEVFTDYKPPKVQVEVEDQKTFHCSITGDPHFHGFDTAPYHLFKTGDFTVYEVPNRDFQVQIRTWPCNGGKVTCICGVSIREKNDVIRVDQCDQPYAGKTTSPTVQTANQLHDATIVQRSADGHNIGVYLPSGSEVRINASPKAMNLHITSPGVDAEGARGLCGTNDGDRRNDFTHPDGTMDAMCAAGDKHCIPNDFVESWRAAPQNSLFETVPNVVNNTVDVSYCQCKNNVHGRPAINCTSRGNVAKRNTACTHCHAITKSLVPTFLTGQGWSKRDIVYVDIDTNLHPYVAVDIPKITTGSVNWPNNQGVTEKQATQRCNSAIHKSPLWSNCHAHVDMASNALADCLTDVLYGGSFDFLESITDQFTSECQLTLSRDPNNYVTDANGDVIMKPELLTDICPLECDIHGNCGAHGKCICDHGWEGEMCHIKSNTGPQLDMIRSGPICDKQARPCKKIFIDATNLDLSDDMVCNVKAVDAHDNAIGNPVLTDAQYLSAGRISCDLPETETANQLYKVSASNEGNLFGNDLQIRVFDSMCLDCTFLGCHVKKTACHIDHKCFANGEVNPTDKTLTCDVTKTTLQWTIAPTNQPLIFKPTLIGPDDDFLYTCKFDQSGVKGDVKVTWLVDGVENFSETLSGSGESLKSAMGLPKHGQLSCRLEQNGAVSISATLTLGAPRN